MMLTTNEDATEIVQNLDSDLVPLLKAHAVSADRPAPMADPRIDAEEQMFQTAGAIQPPYDPSTLIGLFEHSNSLRQNVDAYTTNIDAFGHRFEPVVDLRGDNVDQIISDALVLRAQRNTPSDLLQDPSEQLPKPTPEQVESMKAELEEQMRFEKAKLMTFFDSCCVDMSFSALRRMTRQDVEIVGNGYWEVLRDSTGEIAQFEYIPAFTMRLLPVDKQPCVVNVPTRLDVLTLSSFTAQKRFRRFVQITDGRKVYFKELGDARIVSSKTGKVFDSEGALYRADDSDSPATEVLHFRVHSSRSAYGIPRWIGNLLAVLGSRQCEEVNYSYFENKSVPPMMLLVSGGRLTDGTITRIRDFIQNEVKGKKNWHNILVLEALAAQGAVDNTGKARIDVKPLTGAQHSDALFQHYDERNIDKVGMAFRLPRMLRGDIRDFNRATSEAALEFAETQVFGPERDEFDFLLTRRILRSELKVRFWKFKSNSPSTQNPQDLSAMITRLADVGILTPEEGREIAETVFNKELPNLNAPWVRQPLKMTLAGIVPPEPLPIGVLPDGDIVPDEAETVDEAPDLNLTPTDLALVVTVNEARRSAGLPPLEQDGDLTLAEFRARRTASGQAVGEAEGVAEQVTGIDAGMLQPAQDDEFQRLPVKNVEKADDVLARQAEWLIRIRNALTEAEAKELFRRES